MAANRRQAMCIGATALMAPLTALAQPRKIRIGFLGGISPDAPAQRTSIEPFRRALRDLGYVEGQNLEILFRWAEGQPDRLPGLAAELVRLQPDVIVTMGPGPAFAAKRATTTIPLVAAVVDSPVENGLVADFVRPGGNLTGISSMGGEVYAKRLQLLKELVPSLRRVAILMNPASGSRTLLDKGLRDDERRLGVPIHVFEAGAPDQFDAAFEAMKRAGCDGVLIFADATFWTHRARLHQLLAKHRLPAILGGRELAGRRRPGVLPGRLSRDLQARGGHGRCHRQGRQAGGHPIRASDQARARHQPEVGEGTRRHGAPDRARVRRPRHRMTPSEPSQ